jgi:predicted phage terminase large subunit-like protein
MRDPRAALDQLDRARCARSLYAFCERFWPVVEPGREMVRGRAMRVVCEHLEAVSDGRIKRLLINVPPGTSKSLVTCVFWPAWAWGPGGRPDRRFISWSYAEALALRDNRKCRLVMQSDDYRRLWPDVRLVADQNEKSYFENVARGFRQACGITGATTGYRGDLLVVDDPHNVKQAESEAVREAALHWFSEVLPSRTNGDDAAIVVIMQRVHQSDVSGHVLEKLPSWDVLCLPMEHEPDHPTPSRTRLGFVDWRSEPGELLWPELFPSSRVEELKEQLRSWGGEYAVAGQLQQRPVPREGGMFHADDFTVVDEPAPASARRVRGWDLAGTRDKRAAATVGVLMALHEGTVYVEDVVRIQGRPAEVEALLRSTAERDGRQVEQSIPQDPGQAGKYQKGALAKLLHGYPCRFTPETGSKEDRARPLAAQAEAGNVRLVRAPWNGAYVSEMAMFPGGSWRDQVDASSRAYSALVVKKTRLVGGAPTLYVG